MVIRYLDKKTLQIDAACCNEVAVSNHAPELLIFMRGYTLLKVDCSHGDFSSIIHASLDIIKREGLNLTIEIISRVVFYLTNVDRFGRIGNSQI